ncbi:hypothetical protein [Sphingomonas sp. SAFR-052]|uniref:hypothetical protein n=1 Tax=Sphingomonas sp. SAFR-052 TaxID=3436867 RepID=UPI003F7F8E86
MPRNKKRILDKDKKFEGNENHTEVAKQFGDRLIDLMLSLQIIKDANQGISAGRHHLVIVLSGQLRALLFDDQAHSGPLLLDIAKELRQNLKVYAMLPSKLLPLHATPAMHYMNPMISFEQELPNQVQVDFPQLLGLPYFSFNGSNLNYRNIIEKYANRAGGAHYSKNLPKFFIEQMVFNVGGMNPMQQSVATLGNAVQKVGYKILAEVFGFQAMLHFAMMELPTDAFCLINANSSENSSAYTVIIRQDGSIYLDFTSIDGSYISFETIPCVKANENTVLMVDILLTDQITTKISVIVNGSTLIDFEYEGLFGVSTNHVPYDVSIGKHISENCDTLPFFLVRHVIFNGTKKTLTEQIITQEMLNFRSNSDQYGVSFDKGAFARMPAGENDITIDGKARRDRWQNVMKDV